MKRIVGLKIIPERKTQCVAGINPYNIVVK